MVNSRAWIVVVSNGQTNLNIFHFPRGKTDVDFGILKKAIKNSIMTDRGSREIAIANGLV